VTEHDARAVGDVNANSNGADADRWQLSGIDVRSACTAGYTAVRQDGRYPSEEYLSALAAGFGGFVRDEVERPIAQLGERVGSLTAEAAGSTGLPEGVAVRAGNGPMRRREALRREAVTR
jgi:L-ribulokinase